MHGSELGFGRVLFFRGRRLRAFDASKRSPLNTLRLGFAAAV
jgi:hypothetical protein